MTGEAPADLGRELALLLLRYRIRNGKLSQRQLAAVLGLALAKGLDGGNNKEEEN